MQIPDEKSRNAVHLIDNVLQYLVTLEGATEVFAVQ